MNDSKELTMADFETKPIYNPFQGAACLRPEKLRPTARRIRWFKLMIANSVCACFCVVVTATFINASPATYRPLLKTGSHGADPTLAFAVFGIVVLAAGFVSAAGAALCYVLAARGGEPRGGPIGRLVSFYGKVAVGMTLILALVAISAFGVALGLQAQPALFSSAIAFYGHSKSVRSQMDTMQIRLQCCGSESFHDWFDVPWKPEASPLTSGSQVGFPDSCCDGKLIDEFGTDCVATSSLRDTGPLMPHTVGCSEALKHAVRVSMGYHAGLCFTITVVYCWTTVVVWRTYTSLEKTVLDEVAEHRELVMRRRQAFSRDLQRRLEHRRKSVRRARLDALRKVQLARHRIEVERRDAVFRAERFERTQAREMAKRQARQAERIARRQMMEMLRAAPGTESGRRLEIINQLKEMVEAQRETEMEEHDKMINAKRQAKEAAATIEKLNREASKIIRQIERDGNVEMVPYRQARFFGQLEAANRAFGPRPGFMFNLMRRRKRPTKRRRRRRDDDNDRNTDSDSSDSDKDDEKKDDDDEDANNQNKYVRGRVAASGQQVNYSNSAAKRSKRRTGKTREKSQSVDNADVYFGSRQRQTRQLSDNLYDAGADYEHRLPTDGRLRWLQHQLSPELVYPSLNRPVYGGGYGTVSPYGYWMMGGLAGTAPAIAATATEAAAVRIKGFGDTALRKKVRVTKSSGSSPVGT